MKSDSTFVVIFVVFALIGDMAFRNAFQWIMIFLTVLFVIFLAIHSWMDHKGMFMPGYKKKDKES